jgi:hypothetical protein
MIFFILLIVGCLGDFEVSTDFNVSKITSNWLMPRFGDNVFLSGSIVRIGIHNDCPCTNFTVTQTEGIGGFVCNGGNCISTAEFTIDNQQQQSVFELDTQHCGCTNITASISYTGQIENACIQSCFAQSTV